MKKIIFIIITIIAAGLVGWGVWVLFFATKQNGNSGVSSSSTLFPIQTQTPSNIDITKSFLKEVPDASDYTTGAVAATSSYALQVWQRGNEGGEALMENVPLRGWTLLSYGGGMWDVLGLMEEGVPRAGAEWLVATLFGKSTFSTTSSMAIPSGASFEIGTAKGSVVVNNFYKNATYIASDEAVIIEQSSTYAIVYNIPDSSFGILMFFVPSEPVRAAAESVFLTSLGVSEQDACKLSVHEMVSATVLPQYLADVWPLSFCAPNTFGQ